MSSFEANRLRASDAARVAHEAELRRTFDLHLRSASPSLASAITAAVPPTATSPVTTITTAILEATERTANGRSVATFDNLRQIARATPRNDAIIGHALIAALRDVLGPAFDEPTREAWANGYIRLVEAVMAARRNRLDFVA